MDQKYDIIEFANEGTFRFFVFRPVASMALWTQQLIQ